MKARYQLVIANASTVYGRPTLYVRDITQNFYISDYEVYELRRSSYLREKLRELLGSILALEAEVEYGQGVAELLEEVIHWRPGMGYNICGNCGKLFFDRPALSRKDNKTEICPDCGLQEAMHDFNEAYKRKIRVRKIGEVRGYCKEYFRNVETGRIYCTIDGKFYSVTAPYGEPECPLREDIEIEVIND